MKLNQTMLTLLGLLLVSGLTYGTIAWGATYNFNFNGVEQGENSTAAPVVRADGKQIDPSQGKTQVAKAQAAPVDQVKPEKKAVAQTEKESSQFELKWPENIFQIGLVAGGAQLINGSGFRPATLVELKFALSDQFKLGGFFGFEIYMGIRDERRIGGAELEWVPLSITFGRFNRLIEIGLLAGWHDMHQVFDTGAPAHFGLTLSANLGQRWSVYSTVRYNLVMAMGTAGVAVRF